MPPQGIAFVGDGELHTPSCDGHRSRMLTRTGMQDGGAKDINSRDVSSAPYDFMLAYSSSHRLSPNSCFGIISTLFSNTEMPIGIIADLATVLGLGGAVGGSVGHWCSKHPSSHGCVHSHEARMIQPLGQFGAGVGLCNVPLYNFAQCHDQLKSQGTQVIGSVLSEGSEFELCH